MPTAGIATTIDAFLGGRVEAVQPATRHHRSGLDAVLLAAALDDSARGEVVDLGAGAGVAGLCLAARAPGLSVVLAEREAELLACAGFALRRPAASAFAGRVRLAEADILRPASRLAAGLAASAFDHAIMNPPFHDAGLVRASPDDARARAHVLGEGGLDEWFRAAAALARPGGTLSVILPAARLGDLLAASAGRFGALHVLPVQARPDEPAIRVVAQGVKGSRGPLVLLPPFILHGADGSRFTEAAAAILERGASLRAVHPAWPGRTAATTLPQPAKA